MESNNQEHRILRLMKDEKFIEWKLFPNDEINIYWEKYLIENPHDREIFDIASKSFPKVNISSNDVSDDKRGYVIERLTESLHKERKRKNLKSILLIAAAACVGIIVMTTIFNKKTPTNDYVAITGNEIEALDIQLISNNTTTTFQNNIDIEVDDLGEMKIKNSEGEVDNKSITKNQSINQLIIPFGKRSTILLSDGSKVWLNSGTILEFPSSFSSTSRNISLKTGEIYIEVAKDSKKPFYVNTSNFNIKVYGTKFNVSSYENEYTSVILAEGSIGLLREGKQELLIEPNEMVELTEANKFVKQKVDINRYISWKSGYLIFDNSPITEVLKELEKYYNLSFNFEYEKFFKNNNCKGKIVLSENLDNVLATLSLLTKTEYTHEGNKIYIKNKIVAYE